MALSGLKQPAETQLGAPSRHKSGGSLLSSGISTGAVTKQTSSAAIPSRPVPRATPQGDERMLTTSRPEVLAMQQGEVSKITDKDISFLTALAAMQIQYGRPHEGVAYLMCLRRMRPSDPNILRLLAVALMKMEAWHEALAVLDEMEGGRGAHNPILYLYRAIIRFKLSDMMGAKQFFARFCALKSGKNTAEGV